MTKIIIWSSETGLIFTASCKSCISDGERPACRVRVRFRVRVKVRVGVRIRFGTRLGFDLLGLDSTFAQYGIYF